MKNKKQRKLIQESWPNQDKFGDYALGWHFDRKTATIFTAGIPAPNLKTFCPRHDSQRYQHSKASPFAPLSARLLARWRLGFSQPRDPRRSPQSLSRASRGIGVTLIQGIPHKHFAGAFRWVCDRKIWYEAVPRSIPRRIHRETDSPPAPLHQPVLSSDSQSPRTELKTKTPGTNIGNKSVRIPVCVCEYVEGTARHKEKGAS